MLREISVQNLALIEDLRVELQSGFCAWSGETGAGKTLLLNALGLLLGDRGSSELIRADASELRITGTFELEQAPLRKNIEAILQTPLDGEPLLLQRRLNRSGRSFAYVNDQPVTLSTLKLLGESLVDIHGQRESYSLLQPAYQLQLLDAYGDLDELSDRYRQEAEQVRELRRRLHHLETNRQKRLRELDLIRFEKSELDEADIQPGEIEVLVRDRERLSHAQALQEFAGSASDQLYDQEGSIFEILGKLQRDADHWVRIDPTLADLSLRLQALATESQDIAQTFRAWQRETAADPARRDEVDNRLQLLRRLETKFGRSSDELIAYRAGLEGQEKELAGQEEDRSSLEIELKRYWQTIRALGLELSKGRRKVAKRFVSAVQKQLAELGMPDAQLEAELKPFPLGDDPLQDEIPSEGLEHLELLLAANRGEPARPLRKVASGGELSRTMLALKTVLARHDAVGTLIFDEIDANVGGRLGDILGAKLAELGKSHQVICVTHLPQVACFARHQWTIRKQKKGKRTATTIEYLTDSERLEELASMLRGASRSETTRKEAEAMLASARKRW